jgi:hypothetical protein
MEVPWEPRNFEGTTVIMKDGEFSEDIEIDLGATIVEKLWGVNGRRQWIEALAEAERTGAKMK